MLYPELSSTIIGAKTWESISGLRLGFLVNFGGIKATWKRSVFRRLIR